MQIRITTLIVLLFAVIAFASCDKDPIVTCDDGIMNGDETGVDCGGSCEPCAAAERFGMFAVTNTSDGSGFLVSFDSMPSGEIDINDHLARGVQLA
ncbi:MAG: hypothetical protein AAGM67_14670, partial [Bacteroidota bacterium]